MLRVCPSISDDDYARTEAEVRRRSFYFGKLGRRWNGKGCGLARSERRMGRYGTATGKVWQTCRLRCTEMKRKRERERVQVRRPLMFIQSKAPKAGSYACLFAVSSKYTSWKIDSTLSRPLPMSEDAPLPMPMRIPYHAVAETPRKARLSQCTTVCPRLPSKHQRSERSKYTTRKAQNETAKE